MLPTIEWKDGAVVMIDQRKLPASEVYVTCKTAQEVAKAIKTMVIRGAPAIGVAAAMGLALGMRRSTATGTKQFTTEFQKLCDLLAATQTDRGEPVLGHRADEEGIRRGGARRLPVSMRSSSGSRRKPGPSTTRTSRAAGRWALMGRRWCRTRPAS